MPFAHTKTTFVRPLCEINDGGNVYKRFTSPIQQFTVPESTTSYGLPKKQDDKLKNLNEMKTKQLDNLNSVHSKLFAEVEEIQKWKTAVEMESRQKNKKVEELLQTIESQRKVVLDLQLQNENLSYRLSEEIQQRSFVIEKLHSTKELCSALKKHYNTLQGQFDYRNKIEEMINTSDTKRMRAIDDLKNKFEKICIEHSERIGCLNNALASETNKSLNLKEALEQQISISENEKESLCTLLNNSETEFQKLSKEIEEEMTKSRTLFQEKRELESIITKLEKLNDAHLIKLKEMEEHLKVVEEDKLETEKKFLSENLHKIEFMQKYEKCLEDAKCFEMESEENILSLKETIEHLEFKVNDMGKKIEEEKHINETLSSALQNAENDKYDLENNIFKVNEELISFGTLKTEFKDLKEHVSQLLVEKNDLSIALENANEEILKSKSENETASKLYSEKNEEYLKQIEESENKVMLKENELIAAKENNSELLLKIKNIEEDLEAKSELIVSFQAHVNEKERVIESLQYDNIVLKDNFEAEKTSIKVCLECENLQEKINELETVKASLTKTEEELREQKRGTIDVLRMLNESEKKFNSDRISKEKELINYKDQLQRVKDDIRFKYVKQGEFDILKTENEKLKKDSEQLQINILLKQEEYDDLQSENLRLKKDVEELKTNIPKQEEFDILQSENAKLKKDFEELKTKSQDKSTKKSMEVFEEAAVTNIEKKNPTKSLKKSMEVFEETAVKNIEEKIIIKEIENGSHERRKKKLGQKRNAISRNKIQKENCKDSDSENMSPQKIFLAAPEVVALKKNDTDTKSFENDCFEKNKIAKNLITENKRWEVDSSGSEYLDVSFFKETEQVSLNKSSPKSVNLKHAGISKSPFGVSKSYSFISREKRDSQDISFEKTEAKRQCGQFYKTESKTSNRTQSIKTPESNFTKCLTVDERSKKKNTPSTPITAAQRRFFKTPLVEKENKFKKPKSTIPWF